MKALPGQGLDARLKAELTGLLTEELQLCENLLDCIRKVHAGGRYVSAEVCADVATHLGNELLTPRELRILQLLSEGKENKRVASDLGISIETVKSHVSRIFEKLGCHNRTEAIRIGIRRGILRQMTQ